MRCVLWPLTRAAERWISMHDPIREMKLAVDQLIHEVRTSTTLMAVELGRMREEMKELRGMSAREENEALGQLKAQTKRVEKLGRTSS